MLLLGTVLFCTSVPAAEAVACDGSVCCCFEGIFIQQAGGTLVLQSTLSAAPECPSEIELSCQASSSGKGATCRGEAGGESFSVVRSHTGLTVSAHCSVIDPSDTTKPATTIATESVLNCKSESCKSQTGAGNGLNWAGSYAPDPAGGWDVRLASLVPASPV